MKYCQPGTVRRLVNLPRHRGRAAIPFIAPVVDDPPTRIHLDDLPAMRELAIIHDHDKLRLESHPRLEGRNRLEEPSDHLIPVGDRPPKRFDGDVESRGHYDGVSFMCHNLTTLSRGRGFERVAEHTTPRVWR
jgi:hypothetical protein